MPKSSYAKPLTIPDGPPIGVPQSNITPIKYQAPPSPTPSQVYLNKNASYNTPTVPKTTPKMESVDEDDIDDTSTNIDIDTDTDTDVVDNTPDDIGDTNIQEAVAKILKESPDLITALESVGAMYCIPSTNFTCDNTLKSIRVTGDCVTAPASKNVTGNGKAIMCAIGSVLDYISQRIDDKIDTFHQSNIDAGLKSDFDKMSTPVVSTEKNTYFNDMDDITDGIDINIVDDTISEDNGVDMASEIQESADLFNMYVDHDCSRHMGYEILQEQGFDYIKPVDSVVTESAKTDKSKSKTILASDIKYLKFDNKNLLNAVKCFNEARAEQSEVGRGKIDIKKFINTPAFNKAISELDKQFNARIQLRFFEADDPRDDNEFTIIYDDIKHNLSVSKAKGFQLNGLPISIGVVGGMLDSDAPDDIDMFGQHVVSVILHEIFHNIVAVIAQTNGEFYATLNTTMSIASGINNGKQKRIFLSNYVNTIDHFFDIKMNRMKRRRLVKQLTVLTSVMYNTAAINAIKKDISNASTEEEADKLIKQYEQIIKNLSKGERKARRSGIIRGAAMALSAIASVVTGVVGSSDNEITSKLMKKGSMLLGCAAVSFGLSSLINFGTASSIKAFNNAYKNGREMEEYYCDLFAAMYNLPITFMLGLRDGSNGFTANQLDMDRLNKLVDLEKQVYELSWATYPTTFERNHASVKIAKQLLDSDTTLDPSIKKYLQWIVDNYSSSLNTNIDEIYNTTTFDPKEAEDLDKHLDNLISNNKITLTESFVDKVLASGKMLSD